MPINHSDPLVGAFPRRDVLKIGGGLIASGFRLPFAAYNTSLLSASESSAQSAAPRAKTCILVYLLGGPPQLDTFDLKPNASDEVRGPFKPISTNIPGLQICEHLSQLASMADRYSLIRSVTHPDSRHTPMIYYTLTGRHSPNAQENDIRPPQRTDNPHLGSLLAKLNTTDSSLPGFVALPELAIRSSTEGEFKRARSPLRGGRAGFLGPKYDPFALNDAPGKADEATPITLPEEISADRFQQRMNLLNLFNRRWKREPQMAEFREMQKSAVTLTGASSGLKQPLFSLSHLPEKVHQRYGTHRFGQSMLLARQLAELEIPMVAIHFNNMTICDGWDTHSNNFEACEQELLPMLDQSLSALIEDLEQSGKLEETLIVCMGEFGRTPKINKNAGRDHWGPCSTALLAGGGIGGGRVLGASDKIGSLPIDNPVDPIDIQATMFHCLGHDPKQEIVDHLGRPYRLSHGRVLHELL